MEKEYKSLLSRLSRDPKNEELRSEAIRIGERYAALTRGDRPYFESETNAIELDINQALSGAGKRKSNPGGFNSRIVASRKRADPENLGYLVVLVIVVLMIVVNLVAFSIENQSEGNDSDQQTPIEESSTTKSLSSKMQPLV